MSNLRTHDADPGVELPRARIVSGEQSGNDLTLAFGIAWVVGGVVWFLASGSSGPWGLPGWLLPGAAVFYGLSHVPVWWRRQVIPRMVLGESRSQLAPGAIHPGGRVSFHFTQRMRVAVSARVEVSFVLRETVVSDTGEHERTVQKDHLIRSFDTQKVRIERGELLVLAQELDVPLDFGRSLRTGDWPVSWLVKIHIVTERASFWQEIELPYCEDRVDGCTSEHAPEVLEGFDVVLTEFRMLSMTKLVQVIRSLTPHLTPAQAGELLTVTPVAPGERLGKLLTQPVPVEEPVLLASGLSRTDAESARARLEAAGAKVEVRQQGIVIPAPPGRRLPIPHEDAVSSGGSLPVPSGAAKEKDPEWPGTDEGA